MSGLKALLIWGLAAIPALAGTVETELVMVEQQGCIYCKLWHDQIGPAYPNTAEGRFAPVRHVDLHTPYPEDLTFEGRLMITPTFVLMVDGREVARIEGYPGEDFFWPMIDRMLKENTDYTGGEG